MIIDGNKELQQKVKELLDGAEDKSAAIYEAAEMIINAKHDTLIKELVEQNAKAAADENYRKSLGLHTLSKEENEFYGKVKEGVYQAITAKQIDILPTSIIERTLEDVKTASDILTLVNFAPADVKHWITGEHTGKAVWGTDLTAAITGELSATIKTASDILTLVNFAPADVKHWITGEHTGKAVWGTDLTAAITGELSATIKGIDLEQHKLTVFMVIPKAIRDLALPFVDKYFRAILAEAMQDGLVDGYLNGDGKTGPVGITKKLETFTSTGTAQVKTKLTTIKKFSPKGLMEVRKTLSNNGKRKVTELHLICNPLDEAEFVDPCMYGEALTGGYRNTSFMPIVKHVDANCPKGTGIFTLKGLDEAEFVDPCMYGEALTGGYRNTSFMPIVKHVDANCPKGTGIFTLKGVYTMGISGVRFDEYDQTKAMEDANLVIGKCYANGRADDDNCAVVFDITKLEEYVLPVNQVTAPGAGG